MPDSSQHPPPPPTSLPPSPPPPPPPHDQDDSFVEIADPLLASIKAQHHTMDNLSLMLIERNKVYASELRKLGQCLAKVNTGYATPNEGDQLLSVFTAVREHLRGEAWSFEKACWLETELERIKENQESIASQIGQCLKIIKPDSTSPKDNELMSVLKDIGKHLRKIKSNESKLSKDIARFKEEKEASCRELESTRAKLRKAENVARNAKVHDKIIEEKSQIEDDLRSKLHVANSEVSSAKNTLKDLQKLVLSKGNIPVVGDIVNKVKWWVDDHTRISKELVGVKSSLEQAKDEASKFKREMETAVLSSEQAKIKASEFKTEMETAVSDIEFPKKMELLEKVRWLAHRHKVFVNSKLKVSLTDATTRRPHHHKLQIGLITRISGNEVTVMGAPKSRPLEKGDYLWISETGSALGSIDKVSMPALIPRFVKAVHYVVKVGSAVEVPAGVSPNTMVSCILKYDGLVEHVLNTEDLVEDFT